MHPCISRPRIILIAVVSIAPYLPTRVKHRALQD